MKSNFKDHPEDYEMLSQSVDTETGRQVHHVKKKGEDLYELTPAQEDRKERLMEALVILCDESVKIIEGLGSGQMGLVRLKMLHKHLPVAIRQMEKANPKEAKFSDELISGVAIVGEDEEKDIREKMKGKKK